MMLEERRHLQLTKEQLRNLVIAVALRVCGRNKTKQEEFITYSLFLIENANPTTGAWPSTTHVPSTRNCTKEEFVKSGLFCWVGQRGKDDHFQSLSYKNKQQKIILASNRAIMELAKSYNIIKTKKTREEQRATVYEFTGESDLEY